MNGFAARNEITNLSAFNENCTVECSRGLRLAKLAVAVVVASGGSKTMPASTLVIVQVHSHDLPTTRSELVQCDPVDEGLLGSDASTARSVRVEGA